MRVLCFECYRSRIDRPEPVRLTASPFPRLLTQRELQHRQRMLRHLQHSSVVGKSKQFRITSV
jgi:hypothetical protein